MLAEIQYRLKSANNPRYLPRVRLEYDRVKAELDSGKAELSNTVQIYQQFVDRNIALKKSAYVWQSPMSGSTTLISSFLA
jgi:hypothetical protein